MTFMKRNAELNTLQQNFCYSKTVRKDDIR